MVRRFLGHLLLLRRWYRCLWDNDVSALFVMLTDQCLFDVPAGWWTCQWLLRAGLDLENSFLNLTEHWGALCPCLLSTFWVFFGYRMPARMPGEATTRECLEECCPLYCFLGSESELYCGNGSRPSDGQGSAMMALMDIASFTWDFASFDSAAEFSSLRFAWVCGWPAELHSLRFAPFCGGAAALNPLRLARFCGGIASQSSLCFA